MAEAPIFPDSAVSRLRDLPRRRATELRPHSLSSFYSGSSLKCAASQRRPGQAIEKIHRGAGLQRTVAQNFDGMAQFMSDRGHELGVRSFRIHKDIQEPVRARNCHFHEQASPNAVRALARLDVDDAVRIPDLRDDTVERRRARGGLMNERGYRWAGRANPHSHPRMNQRVTARVRVPADGDPRRAVIANGIFSLKSEKNLSSEGCRSLRG